MIYQTFAQVYERLMDHTLYAQWLAYVQKHVAKRATVLELACGTGDLAKQMSEVDYQVTALDLSEEMLSIASEKLANTDVALLQGDMTDLTALQVTYDAVVCFDDSICYMPDLKQVKAVLKQAYAHLKTGGVLLFDAHSIYQMDTVFPEFMYNDKTEDSAFLWRSFSEEQPHSIVHDLTFFVYNEAKKAYDVFNEEHYERTYQLSDYQRILEEIGFSQIEITADFGNKAVEETSDRWFFKAIKA